MPKNIYYPMHYSVLEDIDKTYKKTLHKKIAFFVISAYYKSLISKVKDIPTLSFVRIENEKFDWSGSTIAQKIKNEVREKYLDRIGHSKGNFSSGYRLKFKFMYSTFKLYLYEETEDHPITNFLDNNDCIDVDQGSYKTLKILDLSDCNLMNEVLLDDLYKRACRDINSAFIQYQSRDNKVKLSVSTKSTLVWGKSGASKYTSHPIDKVDHILAFNKELSFQNKKYRFYNHLMSELRLSLSPSNGRLDTNLTNMPSEAINHLRLEGVKLKEIDMSNCHYLLLSKNLIDSRSPLFKYFNEANKSKLQHILKNTLVGLKSRNIIGMNIPPPKKKQQSECRYIDFIDFIEWSLSGVLYNNLSYLFYGDCNLVLRNRCKAMIMEICYGTATITTDGKKRQHLGKLKALFKKRFPTITFIIDNIKTYTYNNWDIVQNYDIMQGVKHSTNKKGKDRYQAMKSCFALLLQKEESDLFIRDIMPHIRSKGYKVLSKHDSIICKESDYDKVKQLFDERVRRYTNLK